MKMYILLFSILLFGCKTSSQENVKKFSIDYGTDVFRYPSGIFIRSYSDYKDTITVTFDSLEMAKISHLYNKYKIYTFTENYKIVATLVDIPSPPDTKIILSDTIVITTEEGRKYKIKDYFKIRKINGFCRGIQELLKSKPEIEALEQTDIFII